jgi:hypothetical protein
VLSAPLSGHTAAVWLNLLRCCAPCRFQRQLAKAQTKVEKMSEYMNTCEVELVKKKASRRRSSLRAARWRERSR